MKPSLLSPIGNSDNLASNQIKNIGEHHAVFHPRGYLHFRLNSCVAERLRRVRKTLTDSPKIHLAAGKSAAGGRDDTPDFYGLVTALCVAPQRGAPAPDAPAPPARQSSSTTSHSSAAPPTNCG
jgi:hypothetical protein